MILNDFKSTNPVKKERADRIIRNLNILKHESPEQLQLIKQFQQALMSISSCDVKLRDLFNIAFAIYSKPVGDIVLNIENAFNDGVRRDEIIAAACLTLLNLDRGDKAVLKPIIESISKHDPVTQYRSDCYWYEN